MDTIQAMADFIVAKFHPERIVLFGSYAAGTATEDSDVDLLVEVRVDPRVDGRGNPIHRALAETFVVPTDVFIRTTESVEKYRHSQNSIVHEALTTGTVLYEKSGH
jgi:predicted nucleotidyltransferase